MGKKAYHFIGNIAINFCLRILFASLIVFSPKVFSFSFLDTTQVKNRRPQLYHVPPSKIKADSSLVITCIVESDSIEIKSVSLLFKINNDSLFKEFTLKPNQNIYSLQIPPDMLEGEYFVYFIVAEFEDGSVLAFPPDNPNINPIKIPIQKFP